MSGVVAMAPFRTTARILPTWEDGYVLPPTGPGLGAELDEEVAALHPYDGRELHLEMLPREPEP
jgi:L-alanine-DL-glutamate epimerase-like enolase superfamily enzyme